ncbi:sensor histidine kinase [Helcococcus kunzii]|uniref:sensor histidine kinase n=1 Tax=Helcococcus kunzii TaxID=40091 RepID=UPI0024ADB6B9|nr:HAMP domain-containing sensor histidine kinase [Helcococcus kunzii]
MKEKGIRYSTVGLSVLIILSIIITIIFSVVKPAFKNYFIPEEQLKRDAFYNILNKTLYRWENGYEESYFKSNNPPIKYYSSIKKISNYKETEKYIKSNPNLYIYKHNDVQKDFIEIEKGEADYIEYYEVSQETLDDYYHMISDGSGPFVEQYKEPQIEEMININTRDLEFLNSNPSLLKEKLKDELYVDVTLDKNKLNVYINNEEKLSGDTKEFVDYFIDRAKDSESDPSIDSMKIVALLENNGKELVKSFDNKIEYYKTTANMAIFITSFLAMFFIIALATGYEKSKNVKFYQVIKSIPVEFSILGLVAFFFGMYGFTIYIADTAWEVYNIDINLIFVLVITFTLAGLSIFILYLINGLKSFYHEGFNAFLIQNSIVVRIGKGVFNIIRKIISKIYRMIVGNNLTNTNRRLFSFLLLWLLGSAAFGFHPYVLIILLIILGSIYYLISRILSDVQNIEDATYEINKGNFDINLNEDNTYFGNISKNLNNINESLTNAMDKELKSERMKTELITNLSHDLKTPLTAIINYSDLATDENVSPEERKKYLAIVNEKSLKLKSLIERLFEVSKVTSRNIVMNYMDIDLNQMITQMIGEWHEDFSRKGIEVVFNAQKDTTICKLDGEQTSRILDNIFSNINKYAQENTRVYIDLIQNSETRLVVKNISKYSLNITPDELKERFTRGDESRNTDGAGLGLAIASSLTELQNGKFDIEIDGDLFKTIITFNN